MIMEKDPQLVNIYLKIHQKKNLTMDDLAYLAKYAPECFEKTCQNVVYHFPEAKPIMETPKEKQVEKVHTEKESVQKAEMTERKKIENILANLKNLELQDFPVNDVSADQLKSLLGNLYMEMLFPHNDKDTFLSMSESLPKSIFDKKA